MANWRAKTAYTILGEDFRFNGRVVNANVEDYKRFRKLEGEKSGEDFNLQWLGMFIVQGRVRPYHGIPFTDAWQIDDDTAILALHGSQELWVQPISRLMVDDDEDD